MLTKKIDYTNFLKFTYNFIIQVELKKETEEKKIEIIKRMYRDKVLVDYADKERFARRFLLITEDAVSQYIELFYSKNSVDAPIIRSCCCFLK